MRLFPHVRYVDRKSFMKQLAEPIIRNYEGKKISPKETLKALREIDMITHCNGDYCPCCARIRVFFPLTRKKILVCIIFHEFLHHVFNGLRLYKFDNLLDCLACFCPHHRIMFLKTILGGRKDERK